MNRRIYHRDRKEHKKKSSSSATLDSGMFTVRPFVAQFKMRSQDLKASLSQAENYGHHLDKIRHDGIFVGTPIQKFSAWEEENKLMSDADLEVSKMTRETNLPDIVLNVKKQLINLNKSNKNIAHNTNNIQNINSNAKKQSHGAIRGENKTSGLNNNKDEDKNTKKNKNDDEHLISPQKHHVSQDKATEEPSSSQDPEVKALLSKQSNNLLPDSSSFTAASSTYKDDKNTPPPKAKTQAGYLAKREAINILNNNNMFATKQRAIMKFPTGDTAQTTEEKAKDDQQQVKLKNSAELVREHLFEDDKQAKEYIRGNLNLDPDIVEKEGGEELILQKMQY